MTKREPDASDGERKRGGLPYDVRRPTRERLRARAWNPEDRRLFTPKTFGWGYGLNLYWLAHPLRYLRRG